MATRDEIIQAIRNADKAGDSASVRKLGEYLKSMPAEAAPAAETAPSEPPGKAISFAAGAGKGFGDVVLGAQEWAGKGAKAVGLDAAGNWLVNDAKQGRAKLAGEVAPFKEANPLTTGAGEITGNIVATAPVGGALAAPIKGAAKAVPALAPIADAVATSGMRAAGAKGATGLAVRSLGGAITGGASAALVDPENGASTGATVGGLMPGATMLAGKGGKLVSDAVRVRPNNPTLAAKAVNEYGIPLGVADVSGNPLVKATRSVLNDAPLVGSVGRKQGEAVQEGFNRAVGKTFGADAPKLTPEVLDVAKSKMGAEFDRIWNSNTLQFDAGMFQKMQALRASAAKLPQGESARLSSWVDDIESKMVAGPNGEMFMPGDVANRMQSKLRRDAEKATGFLKDDLQNLRKSMLDAFNRSVAPEDAAALAKNMGKYKAFKTVEPLLQGAEVGVAGREVGNVPAALLPQAVSKQYGPGASGTTLGELSQIGSQYVADRVARTGGSARAAVQNGALGAALGVSATASPWTTLAALPAAYGAQQALGNPELARRMLSRSGGIPLSSLVNLDPALSLAYRAAPVLSGRGGGQ